MNTTPQRGDEQGATGSGNGRRRTRRKRRRSWVGIWLDTLMGAHDEMSLAARRSRRRPPLFWVLLILLVGLLVGLVVMTRRVGMPGASGLPLQDERPPPPEDLHLDPFRKLK